MTEAQSYLTPDKFTELKKELEHLKTVRRKEIAEALEYARSLGDLSENAEYQPILIDDTEGCFIWGVVTGSVRVL